MANIVVIGAGIAGLTAAYRLQQAGHQVQVLERDPVVGGRMRTETVGDFRVDRGAQFITSGYKHLQALSAELGLASRIYPVGRTNNAILRNQKLHTGDYDRVLAFLRSDLVSWRTKLRLPKLLWAVWRKRRWLDPFHPEIAHPIDQLSMAEYVRGLVGDEALEYLTAPAIAATFDSEPEDLSGVFFLQVLRFVLGGFDLQCFEGGIGLLNETLAGQLDVRTSIEVQQVVRTGKQFEINYIESENKATLKADAVVVAVPGPVAAKGLLPSASAAEQQFLAQVKYCTGMIVFLLLDKAPAHLPYYGVAFPRKEGIGVYGMALDHFKQGVAPAGAGLLNAAIQEAEAKRLWHHSDDEVVAFVLDRLAQTPVGRLEPRQAIVHRWQPMLPQFYAGYTRHLNSFLHRTDRTPRLYFAGDYLVGPYTECALISGERAAQAAMNDLKA